MDLNTAINCALEGEALLFAGAGFSFGAKNINKTEFYVGDKLRDFIAKECDITSSRPLSAVAEYYVSEKSLESLIELLKNAFSVFSVASWHDSLLSVPWKRIYTTNYDSIIETAGRNNKKALSPTVLSHIVKDKDIKNVCIHLNGYIDYLDKHTIHNEFKLTDGSYSCDSLEGNVWFELFKGDLSTAKVIIIIGYSMQFDVDIKRLLAAPAVKGKVIFIDSPSPDEVDKRLLERYGCCEFIGIESFAKKVKDIQKHFTPSLIEKEFHSFLYEYRSTLPPHSVSFNEINNFYYKGEYIDALAKKNHGEYQYMVLRNAVDVVVRDYLNKKVFLVTSNLGNGKTIFCQLVRNELRDHNVHVFFLMHEYNDCENEIQRISSIKGHCVVIIDDYKNKVNLLRSFKFNGIDRITFVLTTRKSVDPSYRTLINKLDITEDDIMPLYIDRLKDREVESLSSVISRNSLYSNKMSDRTPSNIQKHIRDNCHSRFADLLLELYNSSDIKQRISDVWKNGSDEIMPIKRLAILALMKSVMNIDFNLSEMLNLLKIDFVSLSAKENEFIKEFFNINDDDVLVKSSIVARELLCSVIGLMDFIDTMKYSIMEADKVHSVSGAHLELLKNLVSHSHFRLFKDPQKQNTVASFYDSIRNLSFCKNNTFFWEQFATACIETQEFVTANQCIETAFTIAKEIPGFVPFHIGTIKANYLFEKLLYEVNNGVSPNSSDAIEILVECHTLLTRYFSHPENNVSYVFRVASKYADVFEVYKDNFDDRQKSIFTEKKVLMLKLMNEQRSKLEYIDHPLEEWIKTLEKCV